LELRIFNRHIAGVFLVATLVEDSVAGGGAGGDAPAL